MPVIDDIRDSHNQVKGKGFKYVVSYYVEYYWKAALAVILVAIFLFSIIKTTVTAKDTVFQAILMNSFNEIETEEFTDILQIDTKKEEVVFDSTYKIDPNPENYSETNYTSAQKLLAVIASGSADVMVGDKDTMEYYINGEIFADLRNYFDEATFASLGDKVIYADVIDTETGDIIGENLPLLIDVTDAPLLKDNNCYFTEPVYFSIIVNTKHPDYCLQFYDYLYK